MNNTKPAENLHDYIGNEVSNYLTGEAGSRFNYEMFKYGRTQNMIFERRPYQTKLEAEKTAFAGLGKQDFTYNVLIENDEEKLITGPLFMGYLVKDAYDDDEGNPGTQRGGEAGEEERQSQNQKQSEGEAGEEEGQSQNKKQSEGEGKSQNKEESQEDSNNINLLQELHNEIINSQSAKNIKEFIEYVTIEDPTLKSDKYKNNMKIGPLDEMERRKLIKVKDFLEKIKNQENSKLYVKKEKNDQEEEKNDQEEEKGNELIQEANELINLIKDDPYMSDEGKNSIVEYLDNLTKFLEDTEKKEDDINEMKGNIDEKVKELNQLTKKTYLVLTDKQEQSLVDHKFIPDINKTGRTSYSSSKKQLLSSTYDNLSSTFGNNESTNNEANMTEEDKNAENNYLDYRTKPIMDGLGLTDIPVYLKTDGWFTSHFDKKHREEIRDVLNENKDDRYEEFMFAAFSKGARKRYLDNKPHQYYDVVNENCNPFKLKYPCYSLKMTEEDEQDIYYDKTPLLGIDMKDSELDFELYGNDITEEQREKLFMFPNYYFLNLPDARGHDLRITVDGKINCMREALTGDHTIGKIKNNNPFASNGGRKSKKRKVKRTKRNKNIKKKTIKKKINRKTRKLKYKRK